MKKIFWILIGVLVLILAAAIILEIIKYRTGSSSKGEIDPVVKDGLDALFSDLPKEGEICGGVNHTGCIEGFFCEPTMEFPESPGICVKNGESQFN